MKNTGYQGLFTDGLPKTLSTVTCDNSPAAVVNILTFSDLECANFPSSLLSLLFFSTNVLLLAERAPNESCQVLST